MKNNKFNDGVIDLSQFKKSKDKAPQKPFFQEPTQLTLEIGEDGPQNFHLLVNMVYQGDRQILALQKSAYPSEEEENAVYIVEAVIQDEELTSLKFIDSEEEYVELSEQILKALSDTNGDDENEQRK